MKERYSQDELTSPTLPGFSYVVSKFFWRDVELCRGVAGWRQ